MAYATVNDLRMYYEESGRRGGPGLLLLHGAGGTIDDPVGGWAGLAPSFAEHFHVYCIEHRGHGRTDNPAGFMTFEQIGDDIAEFVERLEAGPVHIAGISDGGVVALDCGLRRPEMTLTVTALGANYSVHEEMRRTVAALDPDALEQTAPDAAAAFARRHDQGKGPGYWKELLRQIADNNSTNPSWTEADLASMTRPTLLIAGENDPYANIDQLVTMRRHIPHAEWLVLNHAGHPVHYELPEIVGPRIIDFLERNA
jgi:pimeloyl-ACP methyl ester carboxylesterase